MPKKIFQSFLHTAAKLEEISSLFQSLSSSALQSSYILPKPRKQLLPPPTISCKPGILYGYHLTSWRPPKNIGSFCFPEPSYKTIAPGKLTFVFLCKFKKKILLIIFFVFDLLANHFFFC